MMLPPPRISKRRASLRLQPDLYQSISVPRRRSARLQSIPIILGSYYESQNLLEQRLADPQHSQTVGATLSPEEVPAQVLPRTFQEYPSLPQTSDHPTRKERSNRPVETAAAVETPPTPARLTKQNLYAFEKMVGQQRKSATMTPPSSITTTSNDFGPQLQRNHVIFEALDARAPNDVASVRELLDQRRGSEPPNYLAYKEYLANTEGHQNELTVGCRIYMLIAKRRSPEQQIAGYMPSLNYAWSEVENHLTTGIVSAKPDIFESYRKTNYPPEALDALTSALAPTAHNLAMPAYALESKSSDKELGNAQLQCAYDGAIMTEGARAVHTYMGKPDDDFYGKTQALTVACNGKQVAIYAHHALQIPSSSQPCNTGVDSSADAINEYHAYLLTSDRPRDSFENFQNVYRHIRNAQDIGYKWATERKDALWEHRSRGVA